MPRFELNQKLVGNYHFHCPTNHVTLSIYHPIRNFEIISPEIVRGVRSGRIINSEGVEIVPNELENNRGETDGLQEEKEKEEVMAPSEPTIKEPEATEEIEVAPKSRKRKTKSKE